MDATLGRVEKRILRLGQVRLNIFRLDQVRLNIFRQLILLNCAKSILFLLCNYSLRIFIDSTILGVLANGKDFTTRKIIGTLSRPYKSNVLGRKEGAGGGRVEFSLCDAAIVVFRARALYLPAGDGFFVVQRCKTKLSQPRKNRVVNIMKQIYHAKLLFCQPGKLDPAEELSVKTVLEKVFQTVPMSNKSELRSALILQTPSFSLTRIDARLMSISSYCLFRLLGLSKIRTRLRQIKAKKYFVIYEFFKNTLRFNKITDLI